MARKKAEESAPPGAPLWMATFGDLMNLLLCFFVLLFSMSSINEEQYALVVASFVFNVIFVLAPDSILVEDREKLANTTLIACKVKL